MEVLCHGKWCDVKAASLLKAVSDRYSSAFGIPFTDNGDDSIWIKYYLRNKNKPKQAQSHLENILKITEEGQNIFQFLYVLYHEHANLRLDHAWNIADKNHIIIVCTQNFIKIFIKNSGT
jgi:hypothetical protein